MNENLYVQGYLQYWDDLLLRNPELWIDSCASGGRRNDLETLRRSVPLHYSDCGYGDIPVKLAYRHTLYQWIPYFKGVTLTWDQDPPVDVDSFAVHCAMAAMLASSVDIHREDFDFGSVKEAFGVWRRAAPYLLNGDFYPMTPHSRNTDRWVAWQFDRPEYGAGLLQAVRQTACPYEALTARLKGLEPEANYLFENPESGESFHRFGADAMRDGVTVSLARRSGGIWFYKKVCA